jgi:hypothetical protein
MRDAAINLRALPQQRDLIDQAAQLLGKNRSDFMLEAACDKAQSVLLSPDRARQFYEHYGFTASGRVDQPKAGVLCERNRLVLGKGQ